MTAATFATAQYPDQHQSRETILKEGTVKNILFGAVVGICLAIGSATAAIAEMTDLEVLFVKADESGDLVLDMSEVLQITIIQFRSTDSDGDGQLEKQELGDLAKDAEFSDNDANKDGSLSFEEVIAEKMADFKAADTNNDGFLTFDEVLKFYENRQ